MFLCAICIYLWWMGVDGKGVGMFVYWMFGGMFSDGMFANGMLIDGMLVDGMVDYVDIYWFDMDWYWFKEDYNLCVYWYEFKYSYLMMEVRVLNLLILMGYFN